MKTLIETTKLKSEDAVYRKLRKELQTPILLRRVTVDGTILGLYPTIIEAREYMEENWGRAYLFMEDGDYIIDSCPDIPQEVLNTIKKGELSAEGEHRAGITEMHRFAVLDKTGKNVMFENAGMLLYYISERPGTYLANFEGIHYILKKE
jgi:hypothetical protein